MHRHAGITEYIWSILVWIRVGRKWGFNLLILLYRLERYKHVSFEFLWLLLGTLLLLYKFSFGKKNEKFRILKWTYELS